MAYYAQAKDLVLKAEEADPSLRSNIAIVKEFRDCNDHVMRALGETFVPSRKIDNYVLLQIDKAKGHVLRAGCDAIDGLAISSKIKTYEAMKGISNGAIAAVYPQYYTDAYEFASIGDRIAGHRGKKDVGHPTLENLTEYANEAKKVSDIAKGVLTRVPHMVEWDRKNRRQMIFERIFLVILVGLAIGIGNAITQKILNPSKTAPSVQTPNVTPPAQAPGQTKSTKP